MPNPNPSSFPQLSDTPFVTGSDWTPSLAYMSLKAPFFTDLPYLGHRDRLSDDELSNDPLAVKARLRTLEAGLQAKVTSGRTIEYTAGTVIDTAGNRVAVPAASFIAPASSTTFLWWEQGLGIQTGPVAPNNKGLIARIVTGVNDVSVLEDLRSPASLKVLPTSASIRVLGGQSSTDKTCSANEVFDRGLYYFRSFTVPTGVTITITSATRIICSGNVLIQGSITVNQSIPGSPTNYLNLGTNGFVLGYPGSGLGFRGGSYGYGAQPFGSGGSSGPGQSISGASWVGMGAGGNGSSAILFEAAGTITVTSSGSIVAKGGDAQGIQAQAGILAVGGSGGGSGGYIGLHSRLGVDVQGTLDVRGGNGSAAFVTAGNPTWGALGGYPGSGGVITIQAPTISNTGSVLMSGGSFGAPANFTTISANVWQISNPTTALFGGAGAGFGGLGGTLTQTNPSPLTYTGSIASSSGLYLPSNIIPVG